MVYAGFALLRLRARIRCFWPVKRFSDCRWDTGAHVYSATTTRAPAGNIKPDKERLTERIDGMVAICNAAWPGPGP
jgi:hypothetical protein